MARRAGGRRWNNAVQARSLTDRLCLAHRSSTVATRALHVAVVVWSVMFFWPVRGAAEPPSTIGVELNRLEIMRRLAVSVSPLRPAKTNVKVFDIAETACSAIGSILVNDVIHCRDKTGDVAGCVDRLTTSSKLAVSLLK